MSVVSKPIYLLSKLIYPALMLTNTVLKLGYLCFWRVNLSKQQKYNGKKVSIEIQSKLIVTYAKRIYIAQTGRKLADRFPKHLRGVEKWQSSFQTSCGLFQSSKPLHSQHDNFLQQGNVESRKNLEQKFIVNSGP